MVFLNDSELISEKIRIRELPVRCQASFVDDKHTKERNFVVVLKFEEHFNNNSTRDRHTCAELARVL